jgi:hypothetical protein
MRGRRPSGPEFVNKLEGSPKAKLRLKVLLETMCGTCRVLEACDTLEIKESRFDQIRIEGLQGALCALEDLPAGRPPRVLTPLDEENQRLRERIAELEAQLQAAAIRIELAATLSNVGAAAEKKTTASPPR